MKTLAIETSGQTFSLALVENSSIISEVFWHSGLRHSERLIPAIKWLMEKSDWNLQDLDRIAVTTGPGSFTGIRVGLSSAKTLAQMLGIPLVGINTLDVLAAGVSRCSYAIYPLIDALRGEVFVRSRKSDGIEIKPVDELASTLKRIKSGVVLVGNGALNYEAVLKKALGHRIVKLEKDRHFPKAGILGIMAESQKGKDQSQVKPLYIRRSWAQEKIAHSG